MNLSKPACDTSPGRSTSLSFPSLAIGRMFGGIPSSFYAEYHKHLPKSVPEEEYDLRMDLYILFHYLNHTVIFGASPHFPDRVTHDQHMAPTGKLRRWCGTENGQVAP